MNKVLENYRRFIIKCEGNFIVLYDKDDNFCKKDPIIGKTKTTNLKHLADKYLAEGTVK